MARPRERDYPGLKRQPFFKRIVGVAGDVVTVDGRDVFINGLHVGRAKTHTFDRRPLDPIAPTVIPPGHVLRAGHAAPTASTRAIAQRPGRAEQMSGTGACRCSEEK